MSFIQTSQLAMLERYLDLAAFRHSLITSNMANVDTPMYRTVDIDFRTELRRALLQQTDGFPEPRVREVRGLIERPDGNNVSLDREGLLMAKTQLQFQAGVQLLRAEFRRLRMAIREGR